jgi:hypothetical protein
MFFCLFTDHNLSDNEFACLINNSQILDKGNSKKLEKVTLVQGIEVFFGTDESLTQKLGSIVCERFVIKEIGKQG